METAKLITPTAVFDQEGKRVRITGLLVDFINSKAASYVEPERKGTARGGPIGMKRKKYFATLFALTNLRVKDHAAQLKIEEKLLGKWRTERAFQNQVYQHRFDFNKIRGNFLADYTKKRAEHHQAAITELSPAEYARFAAEDSELQDWPEELRDMILYHDDLLRDMDGQYSDSGDEMLDRVAWINGQKLKRIFLGQKPKARGPLAEAAFVAYQERVIGRITAILLKNEISDDDRKQAISDPQFLRPEKKDPEQKESPRPAFATKPRPKKKGR